MTDILGERGRTALVSILNEAIVRIRYFGWRNLSSNCAEEADHIHTIPGILLSPTHGQLRHYLEVMAVGFRKYANESAVLFEPHWSVLREVLQELPTDTVNLDEFEDGS